MLIQKKSIFSYGESGNKVKILSCSLFAMLLTNQD